MGPELWREARARGGGEAGWVALSEVFPSGFLSGVREQAWLEEIHGPGASWSPRKTGVGFTGSSPPPLGGMLRLA